MTIISVFHHAMFFSVCKKSYSVFKLSCHPLENVLDYRFKEPDLLFKALLHPSHPSAKPHSQFQRLEFLGDRVLNLVLADLLVATFPDEQEGSLTNRISCLASAESCLQVANTIKLDDYVRGVYDSSYSVISADVIESILGAMYLDGGLEPCRSFIVKCWHPLLIESNNQEKLYKSNLQMWLQSQVNKGHPKYTIEERTGPEHEPQFKCSVSMGNEWPIFIGTGKNRKDAEQLAAKAALDWINKDEGSDSNTEVLPNSKESPLSLSEIIDPISSLYKTKLQELTQKMLLDTPIYTLDKRSGPDHSPTFKCSCYIPSFPNCPSFSGVGITKKAAEQMAAKEALNWLTKQRAEE